MMKLIPILLLPALALLTSCGNEGPPGPQGPRGYDGEQGPKGEQGESGYVFEWENIDFAQANPEANELEAILVYPDDFQVFDADVALVYLLWGDYETDDGEVVEIWRQLPQLVGTPSGNINYNFDFTKYDARLFMQPDYDLNLLEEIDTDNWVARVVIVPANFWNGGRIDFSDYAAVEKALKLPKLAVDSEIRTRRK